MRNRLPRLVAQGVLVRPYPGVYVLSCREHEPLVRVRAAHLWLPRAVMLGPAARVVFGEAPGLPLIDVAMMGGIVPGRGVRRHRIDVPDVVEVGGIRVPEPAWNAAWSAPYDNGAAIDAFLHRGGQLRSVRLAAESMDRMRCQPLRKRIVEESRDLPWSQLEREMHKLLRRVTKERWHTNVPIRVSTGEVFVVDIAFPDQRLVIELDGWEFHRSRVAFDEDRRRTALLVADGWRVIRLTWGQVFGAPELVLDIVRGALGMRRLRAAA